MFLSLTWPILLSATALFFLSFLSWMVLQLHKKDWTKVTREDDLLAAVKGCDLAAGSYMFPMAASHAEMQTPEFQAKWTAGPRGVMTILPMTNMGQNLGLTFVYYLVVSAGLAYLASIAFKPGAAFVDVFRFMFTAGLMTLLGAMVCHAVWFRPRITGHVIEALCGAAITGLIFAAMWPKA